MTKAFKRIPASLVEGFLEGKIELDQFTELQNVLEAAVARARAPDGDGEAVIEAFIIDDSDDEEEEETA